MKKLKYKNRTILYGESKGWQGNMSFSSTNTLNAWAGGTSYKLIREVELFGYKLNLWKRISN